jgi:lysozyme family protein
MKPSLASIAQSYQSLYDSQQLQKGWGNELDATVRAILKNEQRYRNVSEQSRAATTMPRVPWEVIATIHFMECSGRFDQHLHNGDPLTRPTVQEPKGRPLNWLKLRDDQRTWELSALDALAYDNFILWTDWSIPGALYKLEGYNGWGYRGHGINTPYLWSGTQHYTKGKYVADNEWDPNAVSKQLGAAPILKALGFIGNP